MHQNAYWDPTRGDHRGIQPRYHEHNGYIYSEIRKGMYGLPQSGILANQQLVRRLEPWWYSPCNNIPGLWRHKYRPVTFSLVVDDFGVKYIRKKHAGHLLNSIQDHYQVSTDWEGQRYWCISIKWNYHKQVVDLSMPGYVQLALHRFQHRPPSRKEHAPHSW